MVKQLIGSLVPTSLEEKDAMVEIKSVSEFLDSLKDVGASDQFERMYFYTRVSPLKEKITQR
ncbi:MULTISPECIES: hypothetical protein [Nitrosomonas]|nr:MULTISPECIES: hypothetical protein [Nitrosomonas]AKH37605.1 hypothetical protein AAW31_06900 [Nitrosomonas communis]UVS62877.1 hypothetical protein NX761_07175 [Nitrosomonas sp. PLL12]